MQYEYKLKDGTQFVTDLHGSEGLVDYDGYVRYPSSTWMYIVDMLRYAWEENSEDDRYLTNNEIANTFLSEGSVRRATREMYEEGFLNRRVVATEEVAQAA